MVGVSKETEILAVVLQSHMCDEDETNWQVTLRFFQQQRLMGFMLMLHVLACYFSASQL